MSRSEREKKPRVRVGGRDTFVLPIACACACMATHICTCELTIERTRFSVSHRRFFPHVVLRHGAPFSVLPLSRLRTVLIPTFPYACLLYFPISFPFLFYSFSSSSNERSLHERGHKWFAYGFHINFFLRSIIESYLERPDRWERQLNC